jgi:hypothetical protein
MPTSCSLDQVQVPLEQPGVGCEVVGVERRCVHRGGTGIAECLNLVVEDPVATPGQRDRCPGSQSQRQLDADLAATAENYYQV